MPDPVTGIVAVGGAAQASSANKASKRAGNSADAQLRLAEEQAALAREQWDTYKETYQPFIEDQLDDAREDREFYEAQIRPIEQQQIDSVNDDREEFAAGQAAADIDKQYDIAREGEARRLQSYGVDPSSARSIGDNRRSANEMAAAKAAVVNNARIDERDRQFNRRSAVTNMGRVNRTALAGPRIPITPGGVNSAYGAAGAGFGSAAGIQQNRANSLARDAGQFSKGLTNLFLKRPSSGVASPNFGANPQAAIPGFGGVFQAFSEGGPVEAPISQYEIEGPGTETSDSVPAMIDDGQGNQYPARLSDGEYVLPADVVKYHGTKFLDEMVRKVKEGKGRHQQVGLQRGNY